MKKTISVCFIGGISFLLSSCNFHGNEEGGQEDGISMRNTGPFTSRIVNSSEIRDSLSEVFDTPASRCSGSGYLSKAEFVTSKLLPSGVPKTAFPSKTVLTAECLVRAAAKSGTCLDVGKDRTSDCESLLEMKKRISDGGNPFSKPADAATYVKYFLDTETYPPEKYLK